MLVILRKEGFYVYKSYRSLDRDLVGDLRLLPRSLERDLSRRNTTFPFIQTKSHHTAFMFITHRCKISYFHAKTA